MENQRLFLIIALVVIGLTLYFDWEAAKVNHLRAQQAQKNSNQSQIPGSKPKPGGPATTSGTQAPASKGVPSASNQIEDAKNNPKNSKSTSVAKGKRIKIKTDVFNIEISTTGADIRQVDLVNYHKSSKDKTPFRIMGNQPDLVYYMQSGFVPPRNASKELSALVPNHNHSFTTEKDEYVMGDKNQLEVNFVWNSGNGVVVTKTYIFRKGEYKIDVRYKVENKSKIDWIGNVYWQLLRKNIKTKESAFLPTFTGAAIHTQQEGYEKISFDEIQDGELDKRNDLTNQTGGWVAMLEHYFVSAWVPNAKEQNDFYSLFEKDSNQYKIGLRATKLVRIAPGVSHEFTKGLYIGPKIEKNLEPLAKGLELTIDYGWLTIISKPLFWVLAWLHGLLGNWGWAIIFLTILIKAVFYKLSEKSYRSMARMKEIHPRLQALKERCGDNKQALHEGMMKLYREEKINPFGGCLPILIQIPVFIALYYVLLESVELRQAPWMLWIQDMSIPDPYFILPLIMGATMILQHKLNPAPLDPVQAKVMMALPIIFTVFFLFFPAGLVLYWVVNNVLSIAQQWVITRRIANKPIFSKS